MNDVSVLICTRNRPEHLQRCVASLIKQSVKPKEIIIVDDASSEKIDPVRVLNNSFSLVCNKSKLRLENIRIKCIRNKRKQGVVKSRNLGISAAEGSIIAFLDDDGYAHRDWIKRLMKHYWLRSVVGVGGPVVEVGRYAETKDGFKRLSYITRHGDIKHNYRVKKFMNTKNLHCGKVRFLMGGNMSFRKSSLLKVHGFSTQYKGNYYREETDTCMRISGLGKIIFEPSAVTYHNTARHGGTRNVMNLEKFLYWYFRNTIILFFRHFSFKDAVTKTWHQCRKYVKCVKNGTIKTNRDYLITSTPFKILIAILTGTIAGIVAGIIFDKPLKKLMYKHPEYATLITIALIGTTFQIIDHGAIENIAKYFDKL